jgi:hypothetical protein
MNMTTNMTHIMSNYDSTSPGERAAYANGYEAGTVAGIMTGIKEKLKSIQSIIEDTSLNDNSVRLLLKRMCRLELIAGGDK